jgi:hypothetical protein
MTLPFYVQFYAGDDDEFVVRRRNDNPQVLMFIGVIFHRIFGIRLRVRFTFCIIDRAGIQYFKDFFFRNMPAVHAAPGMPGKDQPAMSVKRLMSPFHTFARPDGIGISSRIVTGCEC